MNLSVSFFFSLFFRSFSISLTPHPFSLTLTCAVQSTSHPQYSTCMNVLLAVDKCVFYCSHRCVCVCVFRCSDTSQLKGCCSITINICVLSPTQTCIHPACFCAHMACNPASCGLIITLTCLSVRQAGNH